MLKDFDYKKMYKFARCFYELNPLEVEIIDYLFQYDVAEVDYTSLAKAVGKDNSNIRKAALKLQEKGIVCIVNKYTEDEVKEKNIKINPIKAMFIVDGWIDNLIKNN